MSVTQYPQGPLWTPGNTNYNAVTNTPINTNFLTQLGYKLYVKKLPHVNFFTQEVRIPTISATPVKQASPFAKIPKWGDHLDYEPLSATFVVDAEMINYLEVYKWIRGLTKPERFEQYAELVEVPLITGEGQTSDVGVHVLSSTEEPKLEFVFHDAFPSSLTGFQLKSTNPDVIYVTCDVVFQYSTFSVKQVNSAWG